MFDRSRDYKVGRLIETERVSKFRILSSAILTVVRTLELWSAGKFLARQGTIDGMCLDLLSLLRRFENSESVVLSLSTGFSLLLANFLLAVGGAVGTWGFF